jgi:hypothetical protein
MEIMRAYETYMAHTWEMHIFNHLIKSKQIVSDQQPLY